MYQRLWALSGAETDAAPSDVIAGEKSGDPGSDPQENPESTADAVTERDGGAPETDVDARDETSVCEYCRTGTTYMRSSGRLGCPQCYAQFADRVRPILARVQGDCQHVGKSYLSAAAGAAPAERIQLSALRRRLARAIEIEDYETAAGIRDQIHELRAGLQPADVELPKPSPAPEFGGRGLEWLSVSGPEQDIVISSRVRLARNVQGFAFSARLAEEEGQAVLQLIGDAASGNRLLGRIDAWEMANLSLRQRRLLVERRLASPELVSARGDRGARPGAAIMLGGNGMLSVMVNEEDHLRLQSFRPGLQIEEAWREAEQLDEELGTRLPFAFHQEFGFLTSCLTNAGTGLRASVLIHLPGLALTRQLARALRGLEQMGVTCRGLYGERSAVVGNLFQLSNQTTMGKSEGALVRGFAALVDRVISCERQARGALLNEASGALEDKVWRATGLLSEARILPLREMLNLLSAIRLGVSLKLIAGPGLGQITRAVVEAQPAHLERRIGRQLNRYDSNKIRADYVRELMKPTTGAGPVGREESPAPTAAAAGSSALGGGESP